MTTQEKYTESIQHIKEMIDNMGYETYTEVMDVFYERKDVDDYEELSEWLIEETIWDRETDRYWWKEIFV